MISGSLNFFSIFVAPYMLNSPITEYFEATIFIWNKRDGMIGFNLIVMFVYYQHVHDHIHTKYLLIVDVINGLLGAQTF